MFIHLGFLFIVFFVNMGIRNLFSRIIGKTILNLERNGMEAFVSFRFGLFCFVGRVVMGCYCFRFGQVN